MRRGLGDQSGAEPDEGELVEDHRHGQSMAVLWLFSQGMVQVLRTHTLKEKGHMVAREGGSVVQGRVESFEKDVGENRYVCIVMVAFVDLVD